MSESKEISPLTEFRGTIDRMGDQFLAALPQHVPVEKFKRTVITAVTMNPDLMECDRRTLLAACMKAASDGLLLDSRDAALVKFKTKEGPVVQYMPMISGILKRMRQSGEIKSVATDCVYAADEFDHWRDENGEHLMHRPAYGDDRGEFRVAYAIINTIEGGIYIEVMDRDQIEKVRNVSRAKDAGPWSSWWPEMARKTVLRRLAKRAPMSTDLSDFVSQDDNQYDFAQEAPQTPSTPRTRPAALDAVAATAAPAIEHDGPQDGAQGDVETEPGSI